MGKNGEMNAKVEQLMQQNGAKFNTQKPKAKRDDPRLKEYLRMGKIGVPIWAVIQQMKKNGADRGMISDIEERQTKSEENAKAKTPHQANRLANLVRESNVN